ncbi:hypothetical protein [Veronia pacifica]|uniref:hypothetical protein n=1 Tax=Veronia pacifica TaxID=1080227 RepID=UPI001586EE08|nr:hypothetical protein [Veronia pacifica]
MDKKTALKLSDRIRWLRRQCSRTLTELIVLLLCCLYLAQPSQKSRPLKLSYNNQKSYMQDTILMFSI